ncbi:MAG: ABC transporter permease [Pirellulales bacterium]|nr:ABC transporter permease [Pirellulales bacterium]
MSKAHRMRAVLVDYLGMLGALGCLILIFSLTANNFFTLITFQMIASQIPDITIVSVGMTLVLIIAGIDLSVGSVLALAGATLGACLMTFQLPLLVSIAACLAAGTVCGCLNGLITIRWGLPSFIVTLGMMEAARGGAQLVTDSRTIYCEDALDWITGSILGIPIPFAIAILIVGIGQFILLRTSFGRYMIAIGTNEEAVRLSGIDPRPIKLQVFILCGFLTAVAAVIQTARLSSANPNAGTGLELQAIAAVVIGGTSLMGGRGSVVRSFFGVLIIAVLGVGLAQLGAQEPVKRLITGAVIVVAVIFDYYRSRWWKNI